MKIKLIGDVHGKLDQYKKIVLGAERYGDKTISLGDNGFESEWLDGEKFLSGLDGGLENHKWLAGNHDFYPNYPRFGQSLGDFGVWNDVFFIRGAESIDRHRRIEGRDWFREEELNYLEGFNCFKLYEQTKPDFVVSHTCPSLIKEDIFGYTDNDCTSSLLQQLFEIHQPKIWVFSHMHNSIIYSHLNTTFVCLAELQTLTLII